MLTFGSTAQFVWERSPAWPCRGASGSSVGLDLPSRSLSPRNPEPTSEAFNTKILEDQASSGTPSAAFDVMSPSERSVSASVGAVPPSTRILMAACNYPETNPECRRRKTHHKTLFQGYLKLLLAWRRLLAKELLCSLITVQPSGVNQIPSSGQIT